MKKSLLSAALLLCALGVAAQTAVTEWVPIPVDPSASGVATKSACNTALRAASAPVSMTCVERIKKAAPTPPPTCPAAPAPQTQQAACPSGTTGTFTQTRTASVGPAPTCTITWSAWSPTTPPSGACAPVPPPPPPPTGTALYFSPSGSNANPGTQASPKRDLSGINVSALPAGTSLLFARGGTYPSPGIVMSTTATMAAPLTFGDYGTGERAVINGAITVGRFNNATQHGGYVFRGLKLDGAGSSGVGFMIFGGTRGVVLDDMEVTRWRTGIESQAEGGVVTVKNSRVHLNAEQGVFGWAGEFTIENNDIEANNPSGSVFYHGLYVGGQGRMVTVKGNRFRNNSVVNGTCMGGNLTVHGQWQGGLIENNTIDVPASQLSCYGISTNPGYSSAEWMRNFTIRGNKVWNTGCGVCSSSVPNVLIENNVVKPGGTFIAAGENQADAGDERSSGVVRNNVSCGGSGSVLVAGAVTQSDNRAVPLTDALCAR